MDSNQSNDSKNQKTGTHLLYGHPWTPSSQTNVQETWKRFGWQPIHPLPASGAEPSYQKKGNCP